MTELTGTKAIVKLPKKSKINTFLVDIDAQFTTNPLDSTASTPTTVTSSTTHASHPPEDDYKNTHYLVTDRLYIDRLPYAVNEADIMEMVKYYDPVKVHLNRANHTVSGYILFYSKEMADCAFTLLNGVTFASDIKLSLKINNPSGDYPEPEAHAGILHIKSLPRNITNKGLYDLFRPYGPMALCKIIMEQGLHFKGTALIQYFNTDHSNHAVQSMHNKTVQDNTISVLPFISGKSRPSSHMEKENTPYFTPQPSHTIIKSNTLGTKPSLPNIKTNILLTGQNVDFTNLYIKNLDLNVKSNDLFNNFRKFGHIISARVMKNTQTKQSKGFGFVSFTKAEDAQNAKQEMDGKMILSKAMIVAFHEPKKPRDDQPLVAQSIDHPTRPTTFVKTACNFNHHCRQPVTPPHMKHLDYGFDPPVYPKDHRPSTYIPPSLIPPECAPINDRHTHCIPERTAYPYVRYDYTKQNTVCPSQDQSMKRKHSGQSPPQRTSNALTFRPTESVKSIGTVMTESTSSNPKQMIMNAILAVDKNEKNVDAIADMLLTLKRKDLATCLFNQMFLKSQIKQAKEALDLFQEPEKQDTKLIGPCKLNDKELTQEIDQFLHSLKGLAAHEKKQLLGDRLFPLVKSTGIKHAPRMTIRLLDSIPIEDLAYSMYDKECLKQQVYGLLDSP
ncbi:hypothetical protein BDB01DRAFT_762417 [Pilobolus umbonatus]|nr:hypothetical protein BDB01DRAFT_762417 [Pilobolus umbonatus]